MPIIGDTLVELRLGTTSNPAFVFAAADGAESERMRLALKHVFMDFEQWAETRDL